MNDDSDTVIKKEISADESDCGIALLIRKVIFDKFNDPDLRFTNDEIFKIIKSDHNDCGFACDDVCDMESEFDSLCESGLVRNIAQNFNTIWFKLFDVIEELPSCHNCSSVIHLGRSEERKCPNPQCMISLT